MTEIGDYLIRKIHEEISGRDEMPGSLDELNNVANIVIDRYNTIPVSDFEGLSASRLDHLMYRPFSPECPVRFKSVIPPEAVISSPVIRVCRLIIEAIRVGNGLKLTAKGNLPRKIVMAINDLDIYTRTNSKYPECKPSDEFDSVPAAYTHALMRQSNMVMKRHNKLLLTKKGEALAEDPAMLYQILFTTFALKFNKGYLDGYEHEYIGNLGFMYIVYLLQRYGRKQKEAAFYAGLYFKAFPQIIHEIQLYMYGESDESQTGCFEYRIFDKGFLLFGLTENRYTGNSFLSRKLLVKASALFNHVFIQ